VRHDLEAGSSLADYGNDVTLRIEALNHALAGMNRRKCDYHCVLGSGTARMSTNTSRNTSFDIASR